MTAPTFPRLIEFHPPGPFFRWLGRTVNHLVDWNIRINLPDDPKMVLVFYPHTSNWDALHMLSGFISTGHQLNWLVKHEIYRPPLENILTRMGAIPVNREKNEQKVVAIANSIRRADRVMLALSPEGYIRKTEFWKSGFYHIARLAEVPIHFAYIDGPSRTMGAEPGIYPSGDLEDDLERIRAFYNDKRGINPHQASPIRFRPASSA